MIPQRLLANAAQVSLVSGREAQERHAFLGRQFAEPVVKPYVSARSPAELLHKIIGLHEDAVRAVAVIRAMVVSL